MFLVITSSILNGPIVNFSASFTATGSYDADLGAWNWGVGDQSILAINRLTFVTQSLTGSDVQNYIQTTAQIAHFDINNECNNMLTHFISSSNVVDLFSVKGVTLG